MAADVNLIRGAAAIGRSMRPADLSGLDKVTQAGVSLATKAFDEKRKIEQEKVDAYDEFTKAAETVELNSGALGSVLYNDTVDYVNKQKQVYLAALKSGDQKEMMLAKKNLMDRSTFTQQHKSFIQELAKLKGDGKLSSTHNDNPEELKFMTAVLNGEYQVEQNDKGEIVFNVNGVKKTNAEFEDMYVLKHFDTGNAVTKLNTQHKNSPLFDRDGAKNIIMQALPENIKQFRAALSDDIAGAGSFKKLLQDDQSINEEMLQGFGIADGDPSSVSQDERDKLIDVLTNVNNPNFDLQTSRNIMAEKLTNAVERNHGKFWAKIEREKNKNRNSNKGKIDKDLIVEGFKRGNAIVSLQNGTSAVRQKDGTYIIAHDANLSNYPEKSDRFSADDLIVSYGGVVLPKPITKGGVFPSTSVLEDGLNTNAETTKSKGGMSGMTGQFK